VRATCQPSSGYDIRVVSRWSGEQLGRGTWVRGVRRSLTPSCRRARRGDRPPRHEWNASQGWPPRSPRAVTGQGLERGVHGLASTDMLVLRRRPPDLPRPPCSPRATIKAPLQRKSSYAEPAPPNSPVGQDSGLAKVRAEVEAGPSRPAATQVGIPRIRRWDPIAALADGDYATAIYYLPRTQ